MADEYLTAALYGIKSFNNKVNTKVKEEFGTEKLLDLLSEYVKEIKGDEVEITEIGWEKWEGEITKFIVSYMDEYDDEEERKFIGVGKIISKKFGFIKRLLSNQEIDQEKLDHSLGSCSYIKNDLAGSCIKLTMYLAIEDNPIEFLVSILK